MGHLDRDVAQLRSALPQHVQVTHAGRQQRARLLLAARLARRVDDLEGAHQALGQAGALQHGTGGGLEQPLDRAVAAAGQAGGLAPTSFPAAGASRASLIAKGASREGMKPTVSSGSSTLAPLGPAHSTVPTTSAPSCTAAAGSAGVAAADAAACERPRSLMLPAPLLARMRPCARAGAVLPLACAAHRMAPRRACMSAGTDACIVLLAGEREGQRERALGFHIIRAHPADFSSGGQQKQRALYAMIACTTMKAAAALRMARPLSGLARGRLGPALVRGGRVSWSSCSAMSGAASEAAASPKGRQPEQQEQQSMAP